jgi:RNA polymerase sigma-B factor
VDRCVRSPTDPGETSPSAPDAAPGAHGGRPARRGTCSSLPSCRQDDPERARLREQLVEAHLPLVEYLRRRFRNRGEPLDDLIQVATIGLIKSVDRFDLERGVEFSTYATPTIVGEIKRHFRDKGWAIRVPAACRSSSSASPRPRASCRRRTGARPTVAELASTSA